MVESGLGLGLGSGFGLVFGLAGAVTLTKLSEGDSEANVY